MPKGTNQKRKLMVLARFLLKHSDEEHPVTLGQLQEELERWDAPAERKSIYNDMEQLRQLGLDVQTRRGVGGGWFIGQRDFELAELKLLVDAVQSSRFLTQKKSNALIHKLESLASVYQARQLQRQVYVDRRIKTMNESIFYNVDQLHGAIAANKVISFLYFEINMYKERVYRRGGGQYRVTPYGLIWDNENYYLAGWDHTQGEVRHYRVDKMQDIQFTGERGKERGSWDLEGYTRRHFGMYAGRPCQLRLRCAAALAGVFLDRFGQDIMLVPQDKGHFTVTLDLVVSPPFWGWLFGLGEQVEVLSPGWAVEEFRDRMARVAAVYESAQNTP
ncbi:WYL domain-containing transcriptional regulator [Pseudoflavonifractor capillosus]|uniref:helix-turn-helix transcriptional regulator n=1 Tax=Pseudoflavonifractor capillosus TaxID=106588 RepID=UPI00195D395A|nr:WYL domain-containing transcriptional regulator [Pseudoflavonifractor capillosus]MBM6896008.1 WYL domain-containing transcriptional regulator [Pseudoflavonifractor capillosus]